jgi:predicted nucleic acid-binding protein
MNALFADAFFFIALLSKTDRAHQKATTYLLPRLRQPLLTTAWVLIEVADGLAQPHQRPAVIRLMASLREYPTVEIIPPDSTLFDRGFDLYAQRPDKGWSLTDCISFVVMTERGLTDALTGDHHFEQAGFRALLRNA